MKYIYYLFLFLFLFFDQFPAYPEDFFEIGIVITPWSPIPFLRITYIEAVLFPLFVNVLLNLYKLKSFKFNKNLIKSYKLLLAVFVFGCIIGVFHNGFITEVFFQSRGLLHCIIIFIVVVFFCRTEQGRKNTIRIFIASCVFKSFEGLFFFIFGNLGLTLPDQTPIIFYDQTTNMQLLIFLAFYFFNFKKLHFVNKLLLGLVVVPALISFIFSYRRNFYIAIIIALLFVLFKHIGKVRNFLSIKRVSYLIFSGLMVVGVLNFVLSESFIKSFEDRISSSFVIDDVEISAGSNLFRFMEFGIVWENYKQKPILGAGFGGRYNVNLSPFPELPSIDRFIEIVNNVVHNSYLGILYKTGLVGFVFYIISIFLTQSTLSKYFFLDGDFHILKVSYVLSIIIIVSNLFHPNVFFERTVGFSSIFYGISLQTIAMNFRNKQTI